MIFILQFSQNIHFNTRLVHDYWTHQVSVHTMLNIYGLSRNRLQIRRHVTGTLGWAHHICCSIVAFRHVSDGTFSINFTLQFSFVHRHRNRVLSQLGSQSTTHNNQYYRHYHEYGSGQAAHLLTKDHSDDHEYRSDKIENKVERHAHLEPIRLIVWIEP